MAPMGHGMNRGGSKEKADFKALKNIFVYAKRYLPFIIIAILFAAGGSVATILGPSRVKDLVNLITDSVINPFMPSPIDMAKFVETATTLIIIYSVGAVLSYLQEFIMAKVTSIVAKNLRTDLCAKMGKLPLSYFDTKSRGDILSVATNDVDSIAQTLASSIGSLISSITLFFGVVITMFISNYILAFITIGSSLLGFAAMAIVLKKSQKYFNRKQDDLGALNGHVEEIYTNMKIVDVFSGKLKEQIKFDRVNRRLYEDNWKSQVLSGMNMHFMVFAGNLSYVLIFVCGAAFIANGSSVINLGVIMSFIIYSKLFSQPLSNFAQAMTSVQQASAASRRIFALLKAEELSDESHKSAHLDVVNGDVKFDNIRFGYETNKEIIHGFSADLKKGQKVAIVGPTGAGKTTIVNLLMRFYELNSGNISVDGMSTQDMKRESVHDLFNMILQDTWLFKGTIRENLVFNKEGVSVETLDKVTEAVGLKHFIETLPNGYETMLDEKLNLSEGQKQQLTIARAIIKDAPLLILDEATSSVDTRTELIIQKAMDELTKGRTSFIIAHRLSTIKNADVILVLNKGDIVEQGNHESLLKKNGFYAELYNSQFVDFD